MKKLQVNETLMDAVIEGTLAGLTMTMLEPEPVGASRFFNASRIFSVIVGFSGESSGMMTINLGERALRLMAGRLLDQPEVKCDEESFDAMMELGNMVAGSIKDRLKDSQEFRLEHLSLPSLVQGASYNLYYSRGIHTVSVTFELVEVPAIYYTDRFFTVTVSLLRAPGH